MVKCKNCGVYEHHSTKTECISALLMKNDVLRDVKGNMPKPPPSHYIKENKDRPDLPPAPPKNGTERELQNLKEQERYWRDAAMCKWSTATMFMLVGMVVGLMFGFTLAIGV